MPLERCVELYSKTHLLAIFLMIFQITKLTHFCHIFSDFECKEGMLNIKVRVGSQLKSVKCCLSSLFPLERYVVIFKDAFAGYISYEISNNKTETFVTFSQTLNARRVC